MRIFIEPTDVWLFRDGRPFSAGADHRAHSLFPHSPLTLAGALRTARIAQKGISFDEYRQGKSDAAQELWREIGRPPLPDNNHSNEDKDKKKDLKKPAYGTFEMRALCVATRTIESNGGEKITRYFPMPADVVRVGDRLRVMSPLSHNSKTNRPYFLSDLPKDLSLSWLKEMEPLQEAGGWLSENDLKRYLRGEPFSHVSDEHLFKRESRFSVGIDSERKRPREGDTGGHLFQVEWIRPHANVGLDVEVSGIALEPKGMLALGGEARSARYQQVNESAENPDAPFDRYFKLYFATPAWLDSKKGWRHEKSDDWSPYFREAKVELAGVAIARAQPIGGWDLANNQHKPMQHYIPAGSVFYFRLKEGSSKEIKNRTFVTDGGLAALGFGITYIGGWDYV